MLEISISVSSFPSLKSPRQRLLKNPKSNSPRQQQQQQQRQRGPLSSIISATKRLSFDPSPSPPPPERTTPTARRQTRQTHQQQQQQFPEEMEVTESPADAPGSGRRRPLRLGAGTPVVGSSTLLQKVVDHAGGEGGEDQSELHPHQLGNSSPIERRVATRGRTKGRRVGVERRAAAAAAATATAAGDGGATTDAAVSPSAGRGAGRSAMPGFGGLLGKPAQIKQPLARGQSSSGPMEEEGREEEAAAAEEDDEDEEEEEEDNIVEDSLNRSEDGEEQGVQEEEDQQEEGAQEIGDREAAQLLGRKRPRRSLPAPSPELGSGAAEESPLPKRRRRREADSPAQQQQPVRKARVGRPAKPSRQQHPPSSPSQQPEPETQAQPKPRRQPKAKKQPRKPRAAEDGDGDGDGDGDDEGPSGSVAVTVQRFRKPQGAGDAAAESDDEPGAKALRGDIPFANRGGVNAVDVLSTLCEELIEAYMGKLEERGRAAEDAATRREQKTMYRALEAFREELRTRLLEHTIALDTLHALRKRVRAAQKERLALRDEILRIRAEREQVALRMDAIRIRHEATSKKALRHMSLSSAMHDIDMAVEKGLAAPELSPAEQKKADLANLELLISRVADQACTKSDGGGALKQIKEFNGFLERAAAVLERR
ncbi:hypothetical protein MYCTH_2295152 [Thermothelomyces thermophilus ATCC 42464]|uniref:Inner kinetochore subunit AME1 domain-containing protein n=1 Tax=Thermothelomyces thermophilus (strain ATCC 42464 / BCRC 31852 / DSM 1799) TaxID=573729 RepID=G2Q401_THET4|nr:uncharacterized protein MYCTH_2295152 [Thermothelomyces thermophilus ATCC 42464]AEO53600.1 hypothetical protein MYCTH_2295152 [Thermothelomyces thermophilus ATCC 42464]